MLAVVGLAVAVSGCGINTIPTLEEQAKSAWSQVQNQYQRRAELIPNLVETVKGFAKQEREVLMRMSSGEPIAVDPVLDPAGLLAARRAVGEVYVDQKLVDYMVDLVRATRDPAVAGCADLRPLVAFGASPRASLALAQTARAHAFLRGRGYVVPEDVKAMAPDVLRHRVILTFEAEAEEMDADRVVGRILEAVPTP